MYPTAKYGVYRHICIYIEIPRLEYVLPQKSRVKNLITYGTLEHPNAENERLWFNWLVLEPKEYLPSWDLEKNYVNAHCYIV